MLAKGKFLGLGVLGRHATADPLTDHMNSLFEALDTWTVGPGSVLSMCVTWKDKKFMWVFPKCDPLPEAFSEHCTYSLFQKAPQKYPPPLFSETPVFEKALFGKPRFWEKPVFYSGNPLFLWKPSFLGGNLLLKLELKTLNLKP